MIHVKTESEFSSLISSSKLTVVDFYADWCGPCKAVAPRFEVLSTKYPNVQFLKVDVDKLKGAASSWGVRAMPTFMLFKKGSKIDEVVGADIAKVERLTATHSNSTSLPSSGGRTLGSGSSSASSGVAVPSAVKDNIVYIVLVVFFVYLMLNKSS